MFKNKYLSLNSSPSQREFLQGITVKNSWIFSRKTDLMVFLFLPLVIIFYSYFDMRFQLHSEASFTWRIAVTYFLSSGHLVGTYFPVKELVGRNVLSAKLCLALVSIVAVFTIFLFRFNATVAHLCLAVFLNFHYVRQFVGFAAISQRSGGGKKSFLDDLLIYNFCLFPLFWYLAGLMHC